MQTWQTGLPLVAAALGVPLFELPLAPQPSLGSANSLDAAQQMLIEYQCSQVQVCDGFHASVCVLHARNGCVHWAFRG